MGYVKYILPARVFILAIYSIMTLCLFMATDHLKRLENNYNSSNTYVNIDK